MQQVRGLKHADKLNSAFHSSGLYMDKMTPASRPRQDRDFEIRCRTEAIHLTNLTLETVSKRDSCFENHVTTRRE